MNNIEINREKILEHLWLKATLLILSFNAAVDYLKQIEGTAYYVKIIEKFKLSSKQDIGNFRIVFQIDFSYFREQSAEKILRDLKDSLELCELSHQKYAKLTANNEERELCENAQGYFQKLVTNLYLKDSQIVSHIHLDDILIKKDDNIDNFSCYLHELGDIDL